MRLLDSVQREAKVKCGPYAVVTYCPLRGWAVVVLDASQCILGRGGALVPVPVAGRMSGMVTTQWRRSLYELSTDLRNLRALTVAGVEEWTSVSPSRYPLAELPK